MQSTVSISTATVVERYAYAPYGKVVYLNSNGTLKATQASGFGNTILYTGRRLDTETGLYYFRARYYDSTLGRFIGRDPIGYEGSEWSLYEFLQGMPLDNLDPSGEFLFAIPLIPAVAASPFIIIGGGVVIGTLLYCAMNPFTPMCEKIRQPDFPQRRLHPEPQPNPVPKPNGPDVGFPPPCSEDEDEECYCCIMGDAWRPRQGACYELFWTSDEECSFQMGVCVSEDQQLEEEPKNPRRP